LTQVSTGTIIDAGNSTTITQASKLVENKSSNVDKMVKNFMRMGKSTESNVVANFVVKPEVPHKSKFEFVPHFEHNTFEFMVPEGESVERSLVAIIQFYGQSSSNVFRLVNDTERWFSIGEINQTEVGSGLLEGF
jgi:hypothetical protein